MDKHLPKNPPMPETTKKAGKRRKLHYKGKYARNTSSTSQIYRDGTDAIVADESTESRLSPYGPPTNVRYGGMQFIW